LAALKLLGVIPMICRDEVRAFHDLISKLKEIYGAELDVGRELLRMRGRHMSNGARMVGL
jgi:hypothetical protein